MNLVVGASWCAAIAGIVLGTAALIVFRSPLPAARVTLELFTAAGLLRLSVDATWTAIAATAVVILLRRTVTRSLVADFSASHWRTQRST
ncbi:hypothetical protein [Mycolicibacterium gilvum]|uniref:Uncharacterized protein n=1 Tax=Mycolicibacterium gilvum TaxID=1804 RepID=A0A378SK64_9MYCO|nr:hypothetical protein [Mycolicibacterium gilvum]MCV7059138.1 hypothetical protein [Mycolicibacterium gilvum]STZ43063.1 Uncharacterised protein [Mycolicibacterium gilvum]